MDKTLLNAQEGDLFPVGAKTSVCGIGTSDSAARWHSQDGDQDPGGCDMQNSAEYRKYAAHCERLAQILPEHRVTLLKIANAWRACADEDEMEREGRWPRGLRSGSG